MPRNRHGAWGLDTPALPHYLAWHESAACQYVDPDIFFPVCNRAPGAERMSYREPRKVCMSCPVWEQCREWSLDNEEPYGMWGGLTPRERRALRKQRALLTNRAQEVA